MSTISFISFKSSELPDQYVAPILDRWLKTFRGGNKFFKKTNPGEYYRKYRPYIIHLMTKPESETKPESNCVIRLAVLSDDPDTLLGFSVSRAHILDYVHVLVNHRREGIARKLIPKGITTMSHLTDLTKPIWLENPNYKHWKFNTFA